MARAPNLNSSRTTVAVLRKSPFIIPSAPVLAKTPPTGREWIHEVQHDGWRAQLHKAGEDVIIFTRNGRCNQSVQVVALALAAVPVTSAIIDAELVACDAEGAPNFYALMGGAKHGCCAYCFDGVRGRLIVGNRARRAASWCGRKGNKPVRSCAPSAATVCAPATPLRQPAKM